MKSSSRLKSQRCRPFARVLASFTVVAAGCTALAATIVKDNNPDNLNLGSSWVGGVPPTSADTAQWDNTVTGANAVNLGAATSWAGIKMIDPAGPVTINNDGFTLTNASGLGFDMTMATQDLTLNCPVYNLYHQTWSIPSGRTLTLNGLLTGANKDVYKYGVGTAGAGTLVLAGGTPGGTPSSCAQLLVTNGVVNVTGTLNTSSKLAISSGATVNWSGIGTNTGSYCGIADGSAGTINLTAGTMVVAVSSGVFVGNAPANNTAVIGALNISGGTLKMTASKQFLLGSGYNNGSAGQGIVTLSGTGTLDTTTSTGLFQLGNYGGMGTVNLDGGTLATLRSFTKGGNNNSAGIATFNFNGGTLKANGTNATFMTGLTRANVRDGGAVINDGGYPITIGQALLHSSIGGDNAIDGGLTKSGTGTLTLSGVSTYTGPTVVNQGTLVVPTSTTVASAYSVANGAAFGIKAAVANQTLSISSLTLGTTGASTLVFDNSTFANPTSPLANVTGLALNGTVTVNVSGTGLSVGTMTLMTYTKSGSGSFVLGSLPPGISGSLSDTGTSLLLNITAPLAWRGNAGNVWDINNSGNLTWLNLSTLVSANYTENAQGGPNVTFDDSATGSAAVALDVAVKPAAVTVSNSTLAYELSGAGKLTGSTGLTKNGNGTLTIGTSNDFSGPIALNAGTMVLNGDNRLPANTLAFTRATLNVGSYNQAFSNITVPDASTNTITGAGGSLTLAAPGYSLTQSNAVVDMSGLGNFTFNQPNYDFALNGIRNGATEFKLAATNWFTANNLYVGQGLAASDTASAGNFGRLHLGQVNVFNVTNLQVGGYKINGSIDFQPGLVNPTLTLRGQDGVSPVSTLFVGYNNTGAMSETGVVDLSGGSLDALVDNLFVGYELASSAANGTLTLSAGSLTVTNLYLGWAQQGSPTFTGTVIQNGGTVTIQNLVCGTATVGAPNITSAYHLNGGLLKAQSMVQGTNVGTGTYTSTLYWTNGTLQNYVGSDLLISNVNINASATNAGRYLVIDAGHTNRVIANFSQGGPGALPIILNGPGTLDLQGSGDNGWLSLNVNNGVVLLDKASSPSVHALGYDTYVNGGTLVLAGSGGDQIADPRVVTLNSGVFELNGQWESIGGLAGTGGTVRDTVGSATLTVSVAAGSNYVFGGAITGGNLVVAGAGTQCLTGTDSRAGLSTAINGGTLALGNGGTSGSLNTDVFVSAPGMLAFNRSDVFTYSGSIYGDGDVAQNGAGTVVLAGYDFHTGNTWVNAGTLAVPAGASMVAGTVITVAAGGTLDLTAGSFMTLNSGQALVGAGTVRGSYTLGTGATNQGNLVINGNVTCLEGSMVNPGSAFSPGTITVNGNLTCFGNNQMLYDLASVFTVGGGVNPLLVVSGTLDLSSAAPSLIVHGTPASGTYTLATFGSLVGNPAAVQVVGSSRYTYSVQTMGQSLVLVVAGKGGDLVWRGDGAANFWDNNPANADWYNEGTHVGDSFNPGDNVRFDDTSVNPSVLLTASVLPAWVTVDAVQNYTFVDGGGAIGGGSGLTKTNTGMLSIQNQNGFTGPVAINGGGVSVSTVQPNGLPSPLGAGTTLALNGGAFQFTGGAVMPGGFNRAITVGTNGGVFDQSGGGPFFLTNMFSGSGPLTKAGSGQLILGDLASATGSNAYSGIISVTNGQVQLRNLNALGLASARTVVVEPGNVAAGGALAGVIGEPFDLSGNGDGNGALQANDTGTAVTYAGNINLVANAGIGSAGTTAFTIAGNISGPGGLTKLGANTITLVGTNTFGGATAVENGTLQLGNGLTNSTLPGDVTISTTLSVVPNTNTAVVLPGSIHGTGTLSINKLGGVVALTGANSDWTGPVTVNAGDLWINSSSSLGVGPKTVTINNGTAGHPALHLNGTNGDITLGADLSFQTSWALGTVYNEAGNNTILSAFTLTSGGGDTYFVANGGTLTLAGTIAPNTGSRGLLFGGPANGTISGVVGDYGTTPLRELRTTGTGTWTLTSVSTSVAPANAASGTLLINGTWAGPANALAGGTLGGSGTIVGEVTNYAGGTLSPAGASIGTLTVNSNVTLAGTLWVQVNKSLAQTSDLVAVGGVLTNSGGSAVTVANLGPALGVGDKFTLFSKPLLNGKALAIAGGGAGVVWTNKLEVDGSIQVLSVLPPVNTTPTNLVATVSGNSLNLSWPADHLGWRLQVQTNTGSIGLSTNWFDWPNSTNLTSVNVPLDPRTSTVFFRMVYP